MRIVVITLACALLSACSYFEPAPEPVEVALRTPLPVAVPDTSFCQRIARQDAAVSTPATQTGAYERSYAQCAGMFH